MIAQGGPGRTAVVIPAAGLGERLGGAMPKALRELAGVPFLVRALRAVARAQAVDLAVVAAPPDGVSGVREVVGTSVDGLPVTVVPGGATRRASVRCGLCALPPNVDVVLVHDAARPLAPASLVQAVTAEVRRGAAAVVPALPVTDTVKRADPVGSVLGTLPRETLVAVQTPQGFARAVLERAHSDPAAAPNVDDVGLVAALGVAVTVIDGHPDAFAIARPADLVLAEALLATRTGLHVG